MCHPARTTAGVASGEIVVPHSRGFLCDYCVKKILAILSPLSGKLQEKSRVEVKSVCLTVGTVPQWG